MKQITQNLIYLPQKTIHDNRKKKKKKRAASKMGPITHKLFRTAYNYQMLGDQDIKKDTPQISLIMN